jgi:hypothetical protein
MQGIVYNKKILLAIDVVHNRVYCNSFCHSYGKLWDFIRLHYRISDDTLPYLDVISNHVYTDKHVNEGFNSNEINENITKSNGIDKITRNNKLQIHQIDVQSKIYNAEVPTIQLLEKSQKLLQSVNAILKKSNSIASRLNESNESHNIASLTNARSVIRTSQESSLTLSSSMDDITISGNFSTKNLVRNEILKDANSLFSVNDSENQDRAENICATALKKNCPYDSLIKNKTSDLRMIDNSVSKMQNATSMQNISAGNIVHTCENNDIKNISNRLSKISCNIETQCKKNNIEEEQELWKIPEAVIRTWMAKIILALEALHQQNVLIYNLNPDNILLDEKRHVRLTYIIPQHDVELSKQRHPYSSPELIKFSPVVAITSATDIWSVGVILYELLTGVVRKMKYLNVNI